jgi:hypothetical protein
MRNVRVATGLAAVVAVVVAVAGWAWMTRADGSNEPASPTKGTAGRYAAVINEHRPGFLAWIASERACAPACGTGEALAVQYDALLEMARAFQIDLAVASPPRPEAKGLVSRTELQIRDLRRKTLDFSGCTRTTPAPEACATERDDAVGAWEALPALFSEWDGYL